MIKSNSIQQHQQIIDETFFQWLERMYLEQIKFFTNQKNVDNPSFFYKYMTALLEKNDSIKTGYYHLNDSDSDSDSSDEILFYIIRNDKFKINVYSGLILIVGIDNNNNHDKLYKILAEQIREISYYIINDENLDRFGHDGKMYYCFKLKGRPPSIDMEEKFTISGYCEKFLYIFQDSQIDQLFKPYDILPHKSGDSLDLWKMQFEVKDNDFVLILLMYQYLTNRELSSILLVDYENHNNFSQKINDVLFPLFKEKSLKTRVFLKKFQNEKFKNETIQNHKTAERYNIQLEYQTQLKPSIELYSKKRDSIKKYLTDINKNEFIFWHHHYALQDQENDQNKFIFFQPSDQGIYLGNLTIYQYKQYLATLLRILKFDLTKTPSLIIIEVSEQGNADIQEFEFIDQPLNLEEHTKNLFKIPQMQSIDYLFNFNNKLNTNSD